MSASPKPATAPVELRGVIWVVFAAAAVVTLAGTHPDPDLWGHLRFGLDWWRTFDLPALDPYSFTQDRSWINHEWLSEVAMGAAYLAGGVRGLVLMKAAVIAAALGVLARRLQGASPLVTVAVLALGMTSVIPISLTVRPQLWSVLCLAALAALMDRPEAPGARRTGACVILFACWANLHGGWITGAAALMLYCIVRAIGRPAEAARWMTFALGGIAGTVVNPYGPGLWRFLATTVRSSRPDITEWAPMGLDSPFILWVPVLAAVILPVLLSVGARAAPPRPAVWATLALLVAAALRVHRVAPLMGPAALVLLAPSIAQRWGKLGALRVRDANAARVLWIPALVACVAVAGPVARSSSCLEIGAAWAPDLRAAGHLKGQTGELVTTFDWGEYALWHFGPGLKVSIDGRRETVYSDALVELHRRFERGVPDALEQIRAMTPDYVWLPSERSIVREWLAANGYRIDVDTADSFIAVRNDLPPLRAAPPMPACFP